MIPEDELRLLFERLDSYRRAAENIREMLLSNLVMVGEIPAPTFQEGERVRFLHDRFVEIGLSNISKDEAGNALGVLEGSEGKRNILIIAHTDTDIPETVDHTVRVLPEAVSGPGISDNSLGVAVMATIPRLIEEAKIDLKSNLVLMGASGSLGRGNLAGLRFFVENTSLSINAALCVEGVQLGRLSYYSSGMLRGEVTCTVPDEYDWSRFGAGGAIITMNEVIDAIAQIPIPQRPRTTVNIGFFHGGASYSALAKEAELRFEIRSESEEIVDMINQRVTEIITEVASRSGAELRYDVVARRVPIGLAFSHPLPTVASRIMHALGVQTRIQPSLSDLSVLLSAKIPAITIGITHSQRLADLEEKVMIEPTFTGLAQLLGMIQAIDEGCCDEY